MIIKIVLKIIPYTFPPELSKSSTQLPTVSAIPSNLMEVMDTESSDTDACNTNRYGQKKMQCWHRPKVVPSLKEMEKVPVQRSHRISQMQKKEVEDQVGKFKSIPYEYSS